MCNLAAIKQGFPYNLILQHFIFLFSLISFFERVFKIIFTRLILYSLKLANFQSSLVQFYKRISKLIISSLYTFISLNSTFREYSLFGYENLALLYFNETTLSILDRHLPPPSNVGTLKPLYFFIYLQIMIFLKFNFKIYKY